MGIEITGLQFFFMLVFVVGVPLVGFLIEYKNKKTADQPEDIDISKKRKLTKSSLDKIDLGVRFRKIDWSSLSLGWIKGSVLNFEGQKIPLICTLSGIEQQGAWSQPVKIGVNPLINVSKNYLEKFGKAVVTIAAVNREDVARNIGWGLASYLNVIAGRVLVFEICQQNTKRKHSTRIEMGNRFFDDLPDPTPSSIANVDVVAFDLAYTWPEDILTVELMNQFVNHYRTTYNLIYIIAPPIMFNGFARKAASCSDCCIVVANNKDEQAVLNDSYQRIKSSVGEDENSSLVIWGVVEKSS